MPMSIQPPSDLLPDQLGVFRRLSRVVRSADADSLYDRLAKAESGRVVSVDVARYLVPEFNSWDGRVRHTSSTAAPAGAFAHHRILQELKNPHRERRRLLVTAGGAGSGKTSLLEKQTSVADLVFDNQFLHLHRSRQILNAAVRNRWHVRVIYVHRPFEDVISAVIERSQRTGRWNALRDLARAHIQAQRTIIALRSEFRRDVVFQAQYNATEGRGDRETGARVYFWELDKGGPYHLAHRETTNQKIRVALKEAIEQGVICLELAKIIGEGVG